MIKGGRKWEREGEKRKKTSKRRHAKAGTKVRREVFWR